MADDLGGRPAARRSGPPPFGPDALAAAIRTNAIELRYMPIIACADGALRGFEALARLRGPDGGVMAPDHFIPLAETSGLIGELGAAVLKTAAADAAAWPGDIRLAVNVSPRQAHHATLPGLVSETLAATGLAPARLELEITESALFDEPLAAIRNLERLRALGVRVIMDDFGAGYASLSALKAAPFDGIKLDKAFVADLPDDPKTAAIVNAVLGLGRSLGMPVVAEGVERAPQLAFLRAGGCAEVQGYLLGRPARPAEARRRAETAARRAREAR